VLDFLKSLFKPVVPSGETAKERLRLVLLSDHLSLAPDVIDSLKRDLMEVISRYVEIDSEHADVTFEHRDREIAMLASIPITGVRERKAPEATVFPSPNDAHAAQELAPQLETVAAPKPKANPAAPPRRRRRKKYAAAAAAAAAAKRTAQEPPQVGNQASAQA